MKFLYKFFVLLGFLLIFPAFYLSAQVGINTDNSAPDNSAMLDVKSTAKGVLLPRVTTAQRDQISSPLLGLMIFNTDCNDLQYFNGAVWVPTGNSGLIAQPGSVTGNASPCINDTAGYAIAAIPNATSYHWTVPPGATVASGQGTNSVLVNFGSISGNVCVSGTDDCYRSMATCLPVSLLSPVNASVSITSSANTVCSGTQVTFTATPVNGGSAPAYQWRKNTINISGATNPTYTYAPVNGDVISCRMVSNAPCVATATVISNNKPMTVITNVPVSISITASANNVCAGTQVTFTATPTNGGSAPSYRWRKDGSNISGATNSTYTYVPSNLDKITCQLTSSITCPSGNPALSNAVSMAVNPLSGVQVSIAASVNPVCQGSSVNMTTTPVNGGTSPTYQWKKNGSNLSGATNSVYTFVPANNDQMQCILTSNINCPSNNPATSNTVAISVNAPLPVSVSIAASATVVCAGTQVTFTATPTNGGATPSYQWRKNSVNIAGATNVTYAYAPANGDVITCRMTSSLNCVTGNPATSSGITMTVNANQPVSVTIVASANPVVAGSSVTFTATPVNGGASPLYQWKMNGNIVAGATNSTYTFIPLNGTEMSCTLTSNVLCATGTPATSNMITIYLTINCGFILNTNHTAGNVAPVNKTVSYGTVTNIPGEPNKCWITRNLGASQQASAVDDDTEASAGWYWQFNRKQGYKHDGTTRTPNTTWITSIIENSDWETANDPCTIELGTQWRLPTFSEWNNIHNTGGWTNWNGPFGSGLKLHAAGNLFFSSGSLNKRGSYGNYYSNSQGNAEIGDHLVFASVGSGMAANSKANGYSVRCLRD